MDEQPVPIGIRIAQIKLLQGRIFEALLKEHLKRELNASQVNILFQLWEEDNISIRELSERSKLAKTTLTSMLDRLEQAGWVKRENNPTNRREVRILLSDGAFQAEKECYEAFWRMQAINFKGFQEEEKAKLNVLLERLYQNLAEYEKQELQGKTKA
ncbi:MAG: MarR family transcriptional regulator [bacterium]|nr:MarR family transcriptional regulator [bacterium]